LRRPGKGHGDRRQSGGADQSQRVSHLQTLPSRVFAIGRAWGATRIGSIGCLTSPRQQSRRHPLAARSEIPDGHGVQLRAFCLRESGKLFDPTE
jgi:hypothetical protein